MIFGSIETNAAAIVQGCLFTIRTIIGIQRVQHKKAANAVHNRTDTNTQKYDLCASHFGYAAPFIKIIWGIPKMLDCHIIHRAGSHDDKLIARLKPRRTLPPKVDLGRNTIRESLKRFVDPLCEASLI